VKYVWKVDTTPPMFDNCPVDEPYNFMCEVPAAPVVTATDNCDGPVETTLVSETSGGSGCFGSPIYIDRTWTATDSCGNSDTCKQRITVVQEPYDCGITIGSTVPKTQICPGSTDNTACVDVPTGLPTCIAPPTYSWKILSNGQIIGSTDTPCITWMPIASGETVIEVTVTINGCTYTCQTTVLIDTCLTCGTAFGYWGDKSSCYYDDGKQNWGWYLSTTRTILNGGLEADLYQGNPSCTPNPDNYVGTVKVTVNSDKQFTVDLITAPPNGCEASDLQVWIRSTAPTSVSGRNQWFKVGEPGVYTLTKKEGTLPTGNLFVAVHEVMCCPS